jgi:hypothetical protein
MSKKIMYCPKCGKQNPETGIYCRSCGTDLAVVSSALANGYKEQLPLLNKKGKPIRWDGAISTTFVGMAFLIIAVILGVSGKGDGWWFWMLIPSFACLGSGIAQFVQLRQRQLQQSARFSPTNTAIGGSQPRDLPPPQTDFVRPNTAFSTGDLVPPSVTEGTTRLLDPDEANERSRSVGEE